MHSLEKVVAHYGSRDLEAALLAALVQAGKDPDRLCPDDLAPIDEFHVRGALATRELAQEVAPLAGMQVLDIGSGLGGPSRYLAGQYGCRVVGVDLSESYCRAAQMLSGRLGMGDRVCYVAANALALPFPDDSFDLVWTQHVSMNIQDKHRFYGEIRRVLKDGGRLAFYDVTAGPGGGVHFPVPWASDDSASFLVTQAELRQLLDEAGFRALSWQDVTPEALAWFRQRQAKVRQDGPRPLGLHLLLGADFGKMAQNQLRNLEEGRITLVEAVFQAASRN
ncbi:MAG TPA: methyltransferase domain-containing protein [Geomonas sp.]|nr:methyltransferase domain-containing protein [Geomonas sp.]